MKKRTTIVIAHRLSTIEQADVIVVMDQGRIMECGNHAALMEKGGLYAQLHQRNFDEDLPV
jgi:subfamily B ATP-binding cassette protein MsbA